MRRVLIVFLVVLALSVVGGAYILRGAGISFAGLLPLVRPARAIPPHDEELPFRLPPGFTVRLYSDDVPGARVMVRDPAGSILVSLTRAGSVAALRDKDGDGVAEDITEVIGGLNKPHGLAFVCDEFGARPCELYIAEEDAVRVYAYDAENRKATLRDTLITLPFGAGHSTRSLLLHPDGKRLLVSIGSSCNVCAEDDDRRAAILAVDLATKESDLFATGLRNTVFMETHYVTGEIWGADMGRDLLGDDLPPEEINVLREGKDYGWPYCYGKNIQDSTVHAEVSKQCVRTSVASHIDMQAHSAPLGLAFVPEDPPASGWPEEYWYDLLVAFHGSWNRSVPTGYKLVRIPLDARGNQEGPIADFMTGFMQDGEVLGRPTGLLIEPGGVLYVADDRAGAIYRITRGSLD
jgi:glucose/arabinose dehydrogenase